MPGQRACTAPAFALAFAFALALLGGGHAGRAEGPAGSPGKTAVAPPAAPVVETPAPWATKAPSAWPQLVLTNDAEFRGHTGLSGASAFLIESSRGVVVAATAQHLLGDAGGVEPRLPVGEIDRVLKRWRLFARTKSKPSVEVQGVAVPGLDVPGRDWVVLSLKGRKNLPATPLRLRRRPVEVGERVFLVGCPYTEKTCRQKVYAGKVTARFRRDYWRFDIEPPVEIPGFSGAPIIDAHGLVVGVTSVWFEPRMRGSLWLESGGEDVGAVFDAVETLR